MKMQVLFVLFFITLITISCENDMAQVAALSNRKLGVEEGYNIESFMSTAGRTKAKLTAPYMIRQPNDSSKTEFTKTLHVVFYDSALKEESFLFAKYGKHLEYDNTVLLRDSIVLYNVKKDTLWCHDLIWNQNTGIFYTNKPVVISQDNAGFRQKMYSRDGLTSDQNFTNVQMRKVGIINNPNTNSFITIRDSSSL